MLYHCRPPSLHRSPNATLLASSLLHTLQIQIKSPPALGGPQITAPPLTRPHASQSAPRPMAKVPPPSPSVQYPMASTSPYPKAKQTPAQLHNSGTKLNPRPAQVPTANPSQPANPRQPSAPPTNIRRQHPKIFRRRRRRNQSSVVLQKQKPAGMLACTVLADRLFAAPAAGIILPYRPYPRGLAGPHIHIVRCVGGERRASERAGVDGELGWRVHED
ncbi:hypothetical protein EDC01DRAFT_314825 [Geopyxis carbonaria]|nr:hypothetical protein EDC01DRAFT_314825 [Geopyxis carbonaria]